MGPIATSTPNPHAMLKTFEFLKLKQSLVTRILLFGVFLVIFSGLLRYAILTTTATHLTKVVAIHQEALAKEAARDVSHDLLVRKNFLTKLASIFPLQLLNQPGELSQWLTPMDALNPLFSGALLVIDPEGTLISGSGTEIQTAPMAYADAEFFQLALSNHWVLGKPYLGKTLASPILPMAIAIKDPSGKVQAVLAGLTRYDTPDFLETIRDGRIGETGDYLLIDAQAQMFISATQASMGLKPTPTKGINPLHDRAIQGFRGAEITTNAKGVEEISAMASVENAPWFVVSRIPTAEAFEMIEKMEFRLLWGQAFVLILVIIILITFLLVTFKPLVTSAYLADRMSNGDIPLAPLPIQPMDEVGHLTAPIMLKEQPAMLGVSVGMAIGDQNSTIEALLSQADTQMFLVKNSRQ